MGVTDGANSSTDTKPDLARGGAGAEASVGAGDLAWFGAGAGDGGTAAGADDLGLMDFLNR
jgi:hypothetical protein